MVAKNKYVRVLVAVSGTLTAVGLLVHMVVFEAHTAETTFPGKNGKIAYTDYRKGAGTRIYTINAGGEGRVQVTHNRTDDGGPSWGSRP